MIGWLGIIIMLSLLLAAIHCSVPTDYDGNSSSTLNWCRKMRIKYEVVPGKSFGKLPFHLHAQYLSAKCYEHFCKPHPLAGKGIFSLKCIIRILNLY